MASGVTTPTAFNLAVAMTVATLAMVLPTPATGLVNRASPTPRTFAVYRMLGNDMWPLQGAGQMRQNSVFSARHEEKPPPGVPVFWVINRIVNATERALLVSELKDAGVKHFLYTHPPLNAMHCLSSPQTRVLFAQAQNSVRNAMLRHARENGYSWAIPLDGKDEGRRRERGGSISSTLIPHVARRILRRIVFYRNPCMFFNLPRPTPFNQPDRANNRFSYIYYVLFFFFPNDKKLLRVTVRCSKHQSSPVTNLL